MRIAYGIVRPRITGLERRLTLMWFLTLIALTALSASIVTAPIITMGAVGVVIALALLVEGAMNILIFTILILLVASNLAVPIAQASPLLAAKFCALGALALGAIVNTRRSHDRTPMGLIVGSFVLAGWATITTMFSYDTNLTLARSVALFLLITGTTVALPVYWRSSHMILRTLELMFWILSAVTVISFLAAGFGFSVFSAGRFQGLFANPNTLGFFAAPLFPIGWAVVRLGSATRRTLAYGSLITIAFAILLSGSRAGILSCIVGTVFYFIAVRNKGRALVGSLVVAFSIAFFLSSSDTPIRPEGESFVAAGTGSGRLDAWSASFALVLEKPLTGWGYGTGDVIFNDLVPPIVGYQGTHISSGYLEDALTIGIPMAFLVLMIMIASARSAWQVSKLGTYDGVLAAACFGAIVAGMAENAFETAITVPGGLFALPFWSVLAAANTLKVRSRELRATRAQLPMLPRRETIQT